MPAISSSSTNNRKAFFPTLCITLLLTLGVLSATASETQNEVVIDINSLEDISEKKPLLNPIKFEHFERFGDEVENVAINLKETLSETSSWTAPFWWGVQKVKGLFFASPEPTEREIRRKKILEKIRNGEWRTIENNTKLINEFCGEVDVGVFPKGACTQIPLEVRAILLSYLPDVDFVHARAVCKDWQKTADSKIALQMRLVHYVPYSLYQNLAEFPEDPNTYLTMEKEKAAFNLLTEKGEQAETLQDIYQNHYLPETEIYKVYAIAQRKARIKKILNTTTKWGTIGICAATTVAVTIGLPFIFYIYNQDLKRQEREIFKDKETQCMNFIGHINNLAKLYCGVGCSNNGTAILDGTKSYWPTCVGFRGQDPSLPIACLPHLINPCEQRGDNRYGCSRSAWYVKCTGVPNNGWGEPYRYLAYRITDNTRLTCQFLKNVFLEGAKITVDMFFRAYHLYGGNDEGPRNVTCTWTSNIYNNFPCLPSFCKDVGITNKNISWGCFDSVFGGDSSCYFNTTFNSTK